MRKWKNDRKRNETFINNFDKHQLRCWHAALPFSFQIVRITSPRSPSHTHTHFTWVHKKPLNTIRMRMRVFKRIRSRWKRNRMKWNSIECVHCFLVRGTIRCVYIYMYVDRSIGRQTQRTHIALGRCRFLARSTERCYVRTMSMFMQRYADEMLCCR